jgi:hypothetical protein
MASLRCAGQDSSPEQRHTASPSSRTISEPHTGTPGICQAGACGRGIRAPRGPFRDHVAGAAHDDRVADAHVQRAIWSALCSVALVTTPATNTGAGAPPGWPRRCADLDVDGLQHRGCSCAGNLCAMAQRGARETKPISRWPA